jgi:methylated-DNA-[protein]-cysteine S-methyltransferase
MTQHDTDPEPVAPTLPPADPDAVAAATARFTEAAGGVVDVAYDLVDTPVGEVVVAVTQKGLVRVAYTDWGGGADPILEDLATRLSPRVLAAPARLDPVKRELEEYFAGTRTTFETPIDWSLVVAFGRRVLQATYAIPFGGTSTYGEIAARAGNARAARATGNALGHNPIPIVVPCHRVLAAGNKLGGYTGGTHRKEILLGVEGVLPGRLV